MSNFDQRKASTLASLHAADRSRKGSVDAPIAALIKLINSHRDLVSLSSCSGRISVFGEPCEETRAQGLKGGTWAFASHGIVAAEDLLPAINEASSSCSQLVFRFEPFILAAECRDAATALALVACARSCGFRESGVTGAKRAIAGIRCSLRLEVPITNEGKLLVSESYIRHLVQLAITKQRTNWERIDRFTAAFAKQFLHTALPSTTGSDTIHQGSEHVKPGQLAWQQLHLQGPAAEEVKRWAGNDFLYSYNHRGPSAWQRLDLLSGPGPRYRHSAIAWQGLMVIFGGTDGKQAFNDVWLLDANLSTWSRQRHAGKAPAPRCSHAAALSGDRMFVHGGTAGFGTVFADLFALHLPTGAWTEIDAGPRPAPCCFSHTLTAAAGLLVITGGCPKNHNGIVYWTSLNYPRWQRLELATSSAAPKQLMLTRHTANVVQSRIMIVGGGAACFGFGTAFSPTFCIPLDHLHPLAPPSPQPLEAHRPASAASPATLQPSAIAASLQQAMEQLLAAKGVSTDQLPRLLQELPPKWEKLGDLALVPADCMTSPEWHELGQQCWEVVAVALGVTRLARQARIAATGTRDSQAQLLLGPDAWVRHRENGVTFLLDACACMFSSGNVTERARMGQLQCGGEVVVDLFAGIGYYTLPILVHAGASFVHACEWNPAAQAALQKGLTANGVNGRCRVLAGDCRELAPKGVAHRVLLGLLPCSRTGWEAAVAALQPSGGWVHIHGNVNCKHCSPREWAAQAVAQIEKIACNLGRRWQVHWHHVERVKSFAPHILHVVVDMQCRPA
ncbi:hypothetical protein WJX73_008212 [Symbiochloris irregularis]|uniref:SAM-dependent methyltransferase TRM5/TYW2-type domain-containing protein n=1 Tax=Symbiochloris irregularis TaxID=706552 RepID=A0AAW1P3P5_9CHLO